MKKKILILVNNDIWLYKLRKEIIVALLEENFKIYISSPNGDYIPEFKKWGCEFLETNINRRGKNPIADLKLFISYLRIIKKVNPDVVLTYTIKPNLYGSLACRLLKIPSISNVTGLGSGFNSGLLLKTFLKILYRVCLKESSCVFVQNSRDLELLLSESLINKNYKLIPGSGVNLNEYKIKKYPQNTATTFLFIGRIMKEKGIEQFLQAAKIIKDKYPKTEFKIIGFVEQTASEYKKLLKEFQEMGYIEYLGYKSNVKPYIEESHCIIQPSHSEGLSNVLLEAAASGRPIIASDIPGCREVVDFGKNGFTFEVKNTNSLVERIETFIQLDYEEKKQMGIYSRLKVEKEFDRKIVVNSYIQKIHEITIHKKEKTCHERI